jgi:hypothetical protein
MKVKWRKKDKEMEGKIFHEGKINPYKKQTKKEK